MGLVLAWVLAVLLVLFLPVAHAAEDTIKIGILHSLSGTMAISESVLKDTVLMMIADQNKKGGLLGKKLEPVVVDPASDWDVFADKARELLAKEKVAVVFGCWTSASRKSVHSGVRAIERPAVLPGAVRRRGKLAQCFLHRRGAKPTSNSGGPLFDEQGWRRYSQVGSARDRL